MWVDFISRLTKGCFARWLCGVVAGLVRTLQRSVTLWMCLTCLETISDHLHTLELETILMSPCRVHIDWGHMAWFDRPKNLCTFSHPAWLWLRAWLKFPYTTSVESQMEIPMHDFSLRACTLSPLLICSNKTSYSWPYMCLVDAIHNLDEGLLCVPNHVHVQQSNDLCHNRFDWVIPQSYTHVKSSSAIFYACVQLNISPTTRKYDYINILSLRKHNSTWNDPSSSIIRM